MVKTRAADGTALETMWESRWMPALKWGCSSVGRAPALQAGGQEFESLHLQESNKEDFREGYSKNTRDEEDAKHLRIWRKRKKTFVTCLYLEN